MGEAGQAHQRWWVAGDDAFRIEIGPEVQEVAGGDDPRVGHPRGWWASRVPPGTRPRWSPPFNAPRRSWNICSRGPVEPGESRVEPAHRGGETTRESPALLLLKIVSKATY